jgi:hypothetical protein
MRRATAADPVAEDLRAFDRALSNVLPALLLSHNREALLRWCKTGSCVALMGESAPDLVTLDLAMAYLV